MRFCFCFFGIFRSIFRLQIIPLGAGTVKHRALAGEAVQYDAARQRAYVVSRSAAALVAVDVTDEERPVVLGVLSSKTAQQ